MKMERPPILQPSIPLGNEDIKFVEEDLSSSSSGKHLSIALLKDEQSSYVNMQSHVNDKKTNDNEYNAQYTEIIVIPDTPVNQRNNAKPMECLKPPPTPEFPTSPSPSSSLRSTQSSYILNILSKSPRTKKKSRHEYEFVSARDEDSTYSNVSAASTKSVKTEFGSFMRRKISGSNTEVRKNDLKPEDEEQILETLRQVVRKCTNPDPMKRPSSRDLFDLVDVTCEKSRHEKE